MDKTQSSGNRPSLIAPPALAANSSKIYTRQTSTSDHWEMAPETVVDLGEDDLWPLLRVAFTSKETCQLLGGISPRSLRRLEQRGLLVPSRGLRTKLYSLAAIQAFIEETL